MNAYSISVVHRTGGQIIRTRGEVLGADGHGAIKTALSIINSPEVFSVSARLVRGRKP